MNKNTVIGLTALLAALASSSTSAQPLQNPDPNYRSSISPVVPNAGGSSEGQSTPSNDSNARRVPQLAIPTAPGSQNSMPSGQDQGAPASFGNQVPARALSNEAMPR